MAGLTPSRITTTALAQNPPEPLRVAFTQRLGPQDLGPVAERCQPAVQDGALAHGDGDGRSGAVLGGDRIKRDYALVRNASDHEMTAECREHGDWRRVYKQGCDSKYGTIMVSHSMRAWRHPTFGEFYGGAVVD